MEFLIVNVASYHLPPPHGGLAFGLLLWGSDLARHSLCMTGQRQCGKGNTWMAAGGLCSKRTWVLICSTEALALIHCYRVCMCAQVCACALIHLGTLRLFPCKISSCFILPTIVEIS